jgi:hypothetical protein
MNKIKIKKERKKDKMMGHAGQRQLSFRAKPFPQ